MGQTWERLKLNLPTAAVTDLVVKGNDLVVAPMADRYGSWTI